MNKPKKISYNSDFTELIDDLFMTIRKYIRAHFNQTSIMNGHTKGKNNEYYNGFRSSTKAYPIMFKLTIANNWIFSSWNGREIPSDGDWDNDSVGGGRVVFDETTIFRLEVQLDRLDVNGLNGFYPEADEYNSIKPVEIEFTFTQKDPDKRKFTKANTKVILGKIGKELESFLQTVEEATEKQAQRRFDELLKADEEVAMKYLPETVKDIFVF